MFQKTPKFNTSLIVGLAGREMPSGVQLTFRRIFIFSIIAITILGCGNYHPTPGIYQLLAAGGAIFRTFMWDAFIAIFAMNYMR